MTPEYVEFLAKKAPKTIASGLQKLPKMHAMMKRAMADAMKRAIGRDAITKVAYEPHHIGRTPKWLKTSAA